MANSRSASNAFGGPSFSASANDDADQPQNDWARDTFGTPMQPQAMGANDANPASQGDPNQYSMAEGGGVPDGDSDDDTTDPLGSNAGVEDKTTTNLNSALQVVQQALMYSRKQAGLPGGGGSSDNSEPQSQQAQGGIPDDGGDSGDEGGDEAYAEGGAVGEDIQASNNATDDGPQYGRPEVVDDPDAVHPPISSDNTDPNVPMEQAATAAPAPAGGDESGALPVAPRPNDDSGAAPVAENSPQARSGGIPDEYMPHNLLRNGVQSIIGYLQGKGAMPNDQAVALEKSVSPQAGNDPAAVPVLAVAAARTPDEQAAYLQRNRQVYGVAMAHGQAALNGVEGRPADLNVAIADATKAFSHVPDGDNVHFAKHGDGVVAQVSGAGGTQTRSYALSLQQFGELLDPGKAGMFDRMLAPGGLRKVLSSFGPSEDEQIQGGLKSFQGTGAGGAYGQYGRDPETGKQFNEGNRPSTPSEISDMTRMRRSMGDKSNGNGADPGVLSFPGYRAYQNKYDGGRNADGGSGPQNQVRVISGANGDTDKVYQGGQDVTPDKKQLNTLEQIRARNEGKGTIDDKMQLETLKGQNRLNAVNERGKYYTQHEARLDARSEANRGSREKIHAADTDARLKQIASSSQNQHERTIAADIRAVRLNGGKLTPQQDQFLARVNQQLTQQQAPQQQQRQQQPSADQQALLWANANPNDPRAAKIKQLHGVQ